MEEKDIEFAIGMNLLDSLRKRFNRIRLHSKGVVRLRNLKGKILLTREGFISVIDIMDIEEEIGRCFWTGKTKIYYYLIKCRFKIYKINNDNTELTGWYEINSLNKILNLDLEQMRKSWLNLVKGFPAQGVELQPL